MNYVQYWPHIRYNIKIYSWVEEKLLVVHRPPEISFKLTALVLFSSWIYKLVLRTLSVMIHIFGHNQPVEAPSHIDEGMRLDLLSVLQEQLCVFRWRSRPPLADRGNAGLRHLIDPGNVSSTSQAAKLCDVYVFLFVLFYGPRLGHVTGSAVTEVF